MKALVLGYGRSGKAAEALLRERGYDVVVLDGDDAYPADAAGDSFSRGKSAASPLAAAGDSFSRGKSAASPLAASAEETRHSCRVASVSPGGETREKESVITRAKRASRSEVAAGVREAPASAVFSFAVVSPGIPLTHPWIAACRERGIPLKSELQLGCEELKRRGWRLLAVTGSKGKSSVVKIVADAINLAGGYGVACGNYGVPVCEVVLSFSRGKSAASPLAAAGDSVLRGKSAASPLAASSEETRHSCRVASVSAEGRDAHEPIRAAQPPRPPVPWAVVEVSSFMMETTDLPSDTFEAAAILNLQEDHLDRHGSVEAYHALKRKLLSFAKAEVGAPVSRGKSAASPLVAADESVLRGKSAASPLVAADASVLRGKSAASPLVGSYFDNPVLRANGACAVALMRAAGLDDATIARAFRTFEPLPHRMNLVAEMYGVRYVDDSKATSLAALAAGVEMAAASSQQPATDNHQPFVRLIAGGLPKGDDPKSALSVLTERVRKVYLIGQSAELFRSAWSSSVDCEVCGTMDRAVEAARREAVKGETVLLSPGTASFDQFKSFGERGDVFAGLVKKGKTE